MDHYTRVPIDLELLEEFTTARVGLDGNLTWPADEVFPDGPGDWVTLDDSPRLPPLNPDGRP